MRLLLQISALGAAFAVMWIAFAHRIAIPGTAVESESIVGPLAVLWLSAAGLAVVYRESLRDSLARAASGAANAADDRSVRIILGLLVFSGFLFRIAPTGQYGLNPDEAQLVWVAAAPTLEQVWAYERLVSPHPPAIFLMLHGVLQSSWDLVWLRLPSVLGGTLSIWLTYRLGRELMSASGALAAAWLVAFSPPIFELSSAARNYAPGFAFIVLGLWLFVRFLKTGRWRYFAGYTAAATIAVSWHYVFIVVFVAQKGVLAIELLRRRAPLRSWLIAGAIQLPFAGVMVFLYLNHISAMPRALVGIHEAWYRSMLAVDPSSPLSPLYSLWHLLAPGWLGVIFRLLSLSGVVVFVARRQWLALSFCTLPLLTAIAFAWSGEIPLGGSRHSVYLFPFLFLLVGANVPEIFSGYRETRAGLAQLATGLRWLEPKGRPSLALSASGGAVVWLLGAAFATASLLDYHDEAASNPIWPTSYHGAELARSYRQADVEHAFHMLEERAGPDDWVILDTQSAYALRLYRRLPPVLEADDLALELRDISLVARGDGRPLRHTHEGVQYFHSGRFMHHKDLSDVLLHVRYVSKYFQLKPPPKVWLMRGAWARSYMDYFDLGHLRSGIDHAAHDESGGLLLGIETDHLRFLAGEGK